jgi:2',3'-cyclic-nucleotide 2'-phosphodiesterase (5'-nucleotidase family)
MRTLLQINDLHGYIEPHPELFDLAQGSPLRSGGGLARIATIFRDVRRETEGTAIALDNGDTFHGTMPAVQTHGEALAWPMGALALDGMTAHWEFAYGVQRVRALAGRLPYPILAANCTEADGTPAFPACTVVERGGVRVGVIGLAAVIAGHLLPAADRGRLAFTLGEAELRPLIPRLRREQSADLIVVLSHLGFPQDCKLASEVPGIDVLLSGHTHNRLEAPAVVNGTLIIQSGAHGSFVGRLDLTVGAGGIAGWTHSPLPVDDACEPDDGMAALAGEALRAFQEPRTRVVGETEIALHRYAALESTMDNLLLAATAAASGTAIALSNGWRCGAPIAPGPLTALDLWNIVPANPPVSVVSMTGRELRQLYEDNIEATFACDPWKQRGGYLKRCRGLELAIRLENPPGLRIQELRADGARVRDHDTCSVGFLGEQAVPADRGTGRRSTGVTAVEALERYPRDHRAVAPAPLGHITVI